MLNKINAALTDMQGALVARALYPSEHPLIRKHEKAALTMLHEALEQRSEISTFAVDNRVIFDNKVLPSSPTLAETLFRALHLCGFDRITIRQGVILSELEQVLDSLAQGVSGEVSELESTPHVTLGSLDDVASVTPVAGLDVDASSVQLVGDATDAISDVWNRMDQGGEVDGAMLGDIVTSLSRVVNLSSGAMIPLAPMKRHDEYTFAHTVNVALLSSAMGEVLGFAPRTIHEIGLSALLHDTGKQAIPREILNKAGKFTAEEFEIMKSHPVEGARMLLGQPGVPEVAAIVAYEHHIRADGSGYPKVPQNWKLNLASRVVQMADVFDALRTDRPYRPGKSVPAIIELMKKDVNTFFDGDLLLIFLLDVVSKGVPAAPVAVAG